MNFLIKLKKSMTMCLIIRIYLILDAKFFAYVVGDLFDKCLVDAERDIIAEAFKFLLVSL